MSENFDLLLRARRVANQAGVGPMIQMPKNSVVMDRGLLTKLCDELDRQYDVDSSEDNLIRRDDTIMAKHRAARESKIGYPLERVTWVDSIQPTSSWTFIPEIETGTIKCTTVGFVIQCTKDTLTLAMSLGAEEGAEPNQANGIMSIPLACILKRELL